MSKPRGPDCAEVVLAGCLVLFWLPAIALWVGLSWRLFIWVIP